jgi:hypothetical protein
VEEAASATSTTRSLLVRRDDAGASGVDTLLGRLVPFIERVTRGRVPLSEAARRSALRAYLRQVIRARIGEGPLEDAIAGESAQRYREALGHLHPDEQELVVGRIELAYSYEQLALTSGRPTPDAARIAVKRALLRLAERIADA